MTTKKRPKTFNIGIPLYPGFDPLDVIGPFEVFTWMSYIWQKRKVQVLLVGAADADTEKPAPSTSFSGMTILPQHTFDDCPPLDVIFVPGGDAGGVKTTMTDEAYQAFLKRQGKKAGYVSSVCTGALIVASSGLLDGYQATTHWSLVPCLNLFPKVKVVNGYPRYVVDRNRVTGGGISSGLDEALHMTALITGDTHIAKRVQLSIQYNPHPPFNDGDPYNAEYSVYEDTHVAFKDYIGELCKAIREVVGNSQ
ncbi:MAG TPA: DJ-1/PfpI family protein [Pyrinomonadaceae bacterium]|nr:DJ-1/PfpI family protein [Pyrinomonadaceae bacterium]